MASITTIQGLAANSMHPCGGQLLMDSL